MPLYVDGVEIKSVFVDGVDQKNVVVDGVEVFLRYDGPPSPVAVITTTTLTSGIDFPSDKDLTICMVGGGGSGGTYQTDWPRSRDGAGGYAGEVLSQTVNIPNGEVVEFVAGAGGLSVATVFDAAVPGLIGADSTFGTYATALGGVGGGTGGCTSNPAAEFRGAGEAVTTCLGTANNGTSNVLSGGDCGYQGWGGQSSGYADGGKGESNPGTGDGLDGGAGTNGSGGGGVAGYDSNTNTGAGGNGMVVISWV